MRDHLSDREVLFLILEGVLAMSTVADQITKAAADITTAVATLTANGLPDPTIAPAVASLETAVAGLVALVPPTA